MKVKVNEKETKKMREEGKEGGKGARKGGRTHTVRDGYSPKRKSNV